MNLNKFKKYFHEIFSVILIIILIGSGTFYFPQSAEAATYTPQ